MQSGDSFTHKHRVRWDWITEDGMHAARDATNAHTEHKHTVYTHKKAESSSRTAEDRCEEGHAHIQPVLHLAEISGARIVVDLGVNFVYARQRMHHNHLLLGVVERCWRHNKVAAHALVFFRRRKALLLHARDIENVRVCNHLVERGVLGLLNAKARQLAHNIFRHAKRRRRDIHKPHVVVCQETDEAVSCAAVLEVADKGDHEAVDSAELFTDCVEVKQRLGRMLADTVTRVNDRHARDRGRLADTANLGMAHHNHVAVVLHATDRVVDCLSLLDAGSLDVDIDHLPSKAQHGRLKRAVGPRRRLVK
eukprot:Opistho-2@24590